MELKVFNQDKSNGYIKMDNVSVLSNVKEVYGTLYPDDEYFIGRINPNLTFVRLLADMQDGKDFYEIVGASDSLMRERIFTLMCTLTGETYDSIYGLWVKC